MWPRTDEPTHLPTVHACCVTGLRLLGFPGARGIGCGLLRGAGFFGDSLHVGGRRSGGFFRVRHRAREATVYAAQAGLPPTFLRSLLANGAGTRPRIDASLLRTRRTTHSQEDFANYVGFYLGKACAIAYSAYSAYSEEVLGHLSCAALCCCCCIRAFEL